MPTKSNSLESHYGLCVYWLDATATVKVALFAQKFFQKYPNNTKQARCTRQRDLLVKRASRLSIQDYLPSFSLPAVS